jgi:hypothetical protein
MNVVVPVNCMADVYLPGEKVPKKIKSGSYCFNEIIK